MLFPTSSKGGTDTWCTWAIWVSRGVVTGWLERKTWWRHIWGELGDRVVTGEIVSYQQGRTRGKKAMVSGYQAVCMCMCTCVHYIHVWRDLGEHEALEKF